MTDIALTPKKIIVNGPATIVFWKDGTKTVVKVAESDKKHASVEAGFAMALAKKIYRTNGAIKHTIKNCVEFQEDKGW